MFIQKFSNWPFEGALSEGSDLNRLRRDLFQVLLGRDGSDAWDTPAGVFPLMNVSHDHDNVYVRAEMPGMSLNQLDLSVTGRSLTVSGERSIPEENSNTRYHRREREAGKFRRQLSLPTDVDGDRVQAKYQHGMLMVILPKSEKAKPRKIAISA